MTPKQRLEYNKQEKIRKETEELNAAAMKNRAAIVESKHRKN
jgi:hypothetical protein